MKSPTEASVGYLALKKDEDGIATSCFLDRNIENVRAFISGDKSPDANPSSDPKPEATSPFSDSMGRVLDISNSQDELLQMAAAMSYALPRVILNDNIITPLAESGQVIEKIDGYDVFHLTESVIPDLSKSLRIYNRLRRGLDNLPSAILMSIVATFDSSMTDIIRDMISLRPDYLQGADKNVSLRDVLQSSSIEDLKERIIIDELYAFSRLSHEDQVRYIEKNFHVDIQTHWKRWADFIEVFERRNLVAHGEGLFTKRYVDQCLKHGHKGSDGVLGTKIKVNQSYLRQAADVLLEFSILLSFSLWRKHDQQNEKRVYYEINMLCFNLIRNQKYVLSTRILNYVLSAKIANRLQI